MLTVFGAQSHTTHVLSLPDYNTLIVLPTQQHVPGQSAEQQQTAAPAFFFSVVTSHQVTSSMRFVTSSGKQELQILEVDNIADGSVLLDPAAERKNGAVSERTTAGLKFSSS
jgi:hypothetical protein